MRITANKLKIGSVMMTGEILETFRKNGKFQNVKATVGLRNPKTGKFRLADWGWYSTISIKSEG